MKLALSRTATLVAAPLAVVAVAGIAFASWQSSSSAAGASAGHSQAKVPVTISSVTAPTGIYPTQTSPGNVTINVTNTAPYAVAVNSASVTGVTSSDAGCTGDLTGDFTFGAATLPTSNIAKNTGTGVITIPVTAVTNGLPDGCANANLSFAVTVGTTSA